MEYSFKNSPKNSLSKITLGEKGFQLVINKDIYNYQYTDISKVWLNNPGGFCSPGEFSCTLNIKEKKPIYISSKNYTDNGDIIGQANHYNSFIRILHRYIGSNQSAEFKFGSTPFKYFGRIALIIGILTSCILSTSLIDTNPLYFIIPSAMGIFVSVCGMKFCITRFPKGYNPNEIPLNLLPG
jgi:hypothetical protein